MVTVRAYCEADLPVLQRFADDFWPASPHHLETGRRLQAANAATFLAAWDDEEPVGYVIVHWDMDASIPEEWRGDTAGLEALMVLVERQSQGIGTALVREAERLALARGRKHMCLGVGVTNDGARRLYQRLGYTEAGLPVVDDGGTYLDKHGQEQQWREQWSHMIKVLASSP